MLTTFMACLKVGNLMTSLLMSEESFLNILDVADDNSPLNFSEMKIEQQSDVQLLSAQAKCP